MLRGGGPVRSLVGYTMHPSRGLAQVHVAARRRGSDRHRSWSCRAAPSPDTVVPSDQSWEVPLRSSGRKTPNSVEMGIRTPRIREADPANRECARPSTTARSAWIRHHRYVAQCRVSNDRFGGVSRFRKGGAPCLPRSAIVRMGSRAVAASGRLPPAYSAPMAPRSVPAGP